MVDVRIRIEPVDALIDVERQIRIEGLASGEQIELTATTPRADSVHWQSRSRFVADEHGVVDLSRDAPVAGSYEGVSAMGLIWSQEPINRADALVFPDSMLEALVTTVEVQRQPGIKATQATTFQSDFIQRFAAKGVKRIEVRQEGLVGTLYVPAGEGPFPAVMILNGSGGGINEPRAALYASHGYLAFALAYFKAPSLSDYISNTPLEYFKQGLDWLRREYQPYKDFVALNGQSRGGELVLLLASLFPEDVSAVVAYVPSALVHSGQNAADPAVGRDGPAWLLDGRPLTHIWENNKTATWAPFDEGEPPYRHELAMLTALDDLEAVARARIKVENIQAPVILLSATDDGAWPSSRYSKMVYDKLQEVNFPYDVEWVDTVDGGHSIVFPYLPTTQLTYTHPVSKRMSVQGGRADANAISNKNSWQSIKGFLAKAVTDKAV